MPPRERSKAGPAAQHVLLAALDAVSGAVVALDADLRILGATKSAEAIFGEALPLGEPAPKLFCGEALQRPMAEALAAGRASATTIPRVDPGGKTRSIHVRAIPLPSDGGRPSWALLLARGASTERSTAGTPVEFHGMWTGDPAMKRMFVIVERAARSEVSVLLRGESGAGKELVAGAIHALSPRSKGPFHAINCAALPPSLLESELFGHVRGAFTGAVRDNPGHFRLADKGTLFLDEVGEMPLDLQAKLLRVVETRTVIPVGGRDPIAFDTRIITATHRALRKEVEAGRFRADLMYRLRVVPIFIPALRDRPGDVMLLVSRMIERLNQRGGRRVDDVAPAARALLEGHDYPGNVRELQNVLEYAYVIGDGPTLQESDLPPELLELDADPGTPGEGLSFADNVPPALSTEPAASSEAARILRALERASGSRDRAAKVLGYSRVTLWRRMRALGLVGDDGGE
jgi:transcriptional regulator with PAS, ATPase and Fis domain